MADKIVRATAFNNEVLILSCTSKETVQKAVNCHNTSDVASAALGRTLSIAGMMGILMKNQDDRLTLTFKGNGKLGKIVVTADNDGNVKGYVDNPNIILPYKNGKLDVSRAVGDGHLTVIRDTNLKEPYIGDVEIQTGEIAEDMAYYFATSEQIPSAVGLGVLVKGKNDIDVSGGFLIQMLPFAREETLQKVENAISNIKSITDILKNDNSPFAIIKQLFGEFQSDIKYLEEKNMNFKCNCSKDRLTKVLISLGRNELNDIVKENKPIDIRCSFCNSNYNFKIDEIKELLNNI